MLLKVKIFVPCSENMNLELQVYLILKMAINEINDILLFFFLEILHF